MKETITRCDNCKKKINKTIYRFNYALCSFEVCRNCFYKASSIKRQMEKLQKEYENKEKTWFENNLKGLYEILFDEEVR